ncbi:MAG TPA: AraC family transcriptional regulator, partial [Acidimicrobiales bacterium]|nr:AraC family transcriptional regulator [Acidimicrobiales bacterium]
MRDRHVVIVVFDRVQPLDAVGPHEVFAGAGRAAASARRAGGYRVTLASSGGGTVRAESGLELGTAPLPGDGEAIDTLVLAGGSGANDAAADDSLVAWIRATSPRCRRVATVCSGTFLGAAAGLLGGRRVTTHWARAQELRDAHPDLTVDPDPIYIRDGKIWSSAGVTAGIDLALAMVQD